MYDCLFHKLLLNNNILFVKNFQLKNGNEVRIFALPVYNNYMTLCVVTVVLIKFAADYFLCNNNYIS